MPDSRQPVRNGDRISFGSLTDSLGFLLRMSQLKSFAEFYHDLGALGLKPGQISILIVIAENPGVRQGMVAEALSIKRAHMTKLVRALEDEGLITRTVPQGDKRSVELRLSELGERKMAEWQGPVQAHEKRVRFPLRPSEQERLKALLRRYLSMTLPEKDGQ